MSGELAGGWVLASDQIELRKTWGKEKRKKERGKEDHPSCAEARIQKPDVRDIL